MQVVQPYPTRANPSFVEVGREARAVEVVGDHARARGQRGLHPRLASAGPASTAFFASSPAASITDGLDVFVQRRDGGDHHRAVLHDLAVDRHRSLAPGSIVASVSTSTSAFPLLLEPADVARVGDQAPARSRNAATNDSQTSARGTRSCGRFGPATDGSTAARSSSSDLGEPRLGVAIGPEQPLFLRVALDQVDRRRLGR